MATDGRKPAVRKAPPRASRKRPPTPLPAEQPMEIHKPKPIHNWRELTIEIGVIVIGILIALGLEQAVESWHTRERTEVALRAVDTEVRFNLAKANRLNDMRGCMGRQMAALSAAIGRGDQVEVRRLMAAGYFIQPFPWTDAAWRTAVASNDADRFAPERRRSYWLLYGTINATNDAQSRYWNAVNRLQAIVVGGLSASPAASAAELSEMATLAGAEEQMLHATDIVRLNAKRLFGFESTQAEMAAIPAPAGELEQCRAAAAALGPQPND